MVTEEIRRLPCGSRPAVYSGKWPYRMTVISAVATANGAANSLIIILNSKLRVSILSILATS